MRPSSSSNSVEAKKKASAARVKATSLRATSGRNKVKSLDACAQPSILVKAKSTKRGRQMSDEDVLKDAKQVMKLLDAAVKNYEGQSDILEAAIGAYILGRHIGWKPLLLIHDKKTLRKYEEHLGIDSFRSHMPPEGELAKKSKAYNGAIKLGNFWKAVSGQAPGIRGNMLTRKLKGA